jgi:hypothetical protein
MGILAGRGAGGNDEYPTVSAKSPRSPRAAIPAMSCRKDAGREEANRLEWFYVYPDRACIA